MQWLRADHYKVAVGNENAKEFQPWLSQVVRQIFGTEWGVAQQQRLAQNRGRGNYAESYRVSEFVQIRLSACIDIRNVLVRTQHESMDTVLY